MDQNSVAPNAFFGKYLVDKGVITQDTLNEAIAYQNEVNRRIGDHAVQNGFLTQEQAAEILEEQKKVDEPFGAIATRRKFLTQEQLDDLLFSQIVNSTYLGEALLEMGRITPEDFSENLRDYTRQENRRRTELATSLEHYQHHECLEAAIGALRRGFIRFAGGELKTNALCNENECGVFDIRFDLTVTVEDEGIVACSIYLPESLAGKITKDFPAEEDALCDDECMRNCGFFFHYVERYFIAGLEEYSMKAGQSRLAGERRSGPMHREPGDAVVFLDTTDHTIALRINVLPAV